MAIIKRDKFGRFVSPRRGVRRVQSKPLRDDLGRFTVAVRKVVKKKDSRPEGLRSEGTRSKGGKREETAKKGVQAKPSDKSSSKKVEPKKGSGKKSGAKVVVRKPTPSKVSPGKKVGARVSVKKGPAKKRPVRKGSAKKEPPKKAPVAKPKKVVPKKPVVSKKPEVKKAKKPAAGKPSKKRKKKAELPPVPVRSREAETVIQAKLATLLGLINMTEGGLDMAIQSFINGDGSVDGELRISSLPERWRDPRGLPDLIATLSSAFQTFPVFDKSPSFGGGFWATFGVRFGPQNETEAGELADLYKRFRGLFQIGTYPSPAWNSGPIQIAITDDKMGLRSMIHSLEAKRGIPPSAILIRFLWGPEWSHNSRMRPGHYKGEK